MPCTLSAKQSRRSCNIDWQWVKEAADLFTLLLLLNIDDRLDRLDRIVQLAADCVLGFDLISPAAYY